MLRRAVPATPFRNRGRRLTADANLRLMIADERIARSGRVDEYYPGCDTWVARRATGKKITAGKEKNIDGQQPGLTGTQI